MRCIFIYRGGNHQWMPPPRMPVPAPPTSPPPTLMTSTANGSWPITIFQGTIFIIRRADGVIIVAFGARGNFQGAMAFPR